MGCPAALASCWLLWTVWPDHFWDGRAANPKPLDQEQLDFSRNLRDKTVWVWGQSTRHSCSTWQDPMGTLRFKHFGTLATWFTLSRNANAGTWCLRWFWTFWFRDQLCGIFCRFGGSVGQWNFLPVGQGVFFGKACGGAVKQFCWADGFSGVAGQVRPCPSIDMDFGALHPCNCLYRNLTGYLQLCHLSICGSCLHNSGLSTVPWVRSLQNWRSWSFLWCVYVYACTFRIWQSMISRRYCIVYILYITMQCVLYTCNYLKHLMYTRYTTQCVFFFPKSSQCMKPFFFKWNI